MKYTVGYNLTEAFDFASKRPRSHLQSPDLNNLKDKQKLSRLASKIEIILNNKDNLRLSTLLSILDIYSRHWT